MYNQLYLQHIKKVPLNQYIAIIWDHLLSSVVNAPKVKTFEVRFNKCWSDLEVKFNYQVPRLRQLQSPQHQ